MKAGAFGPVTQTVQRARSGRSCNAIVFEDQRKGKGVVIRVQSYADSRRALLLGFAALVTSTQLQIMPALATETEVPLNKHISEFMALLCRPMLWL